MPRKAMFFESWSGLGRTAVAACLTYAALVLILRASGKRTLTKLNAFDLVITVALGSSLATVILSKDVPLVEGFLGIAVLVALQYLVTWSSLRWRRVQRLVKSEPTLLLHRGMVLRDQLRKQRVTAEELRAAIRAQGMGRMEDVEAVILETDGSFSVIQRSDQRLTAVDRDVAASDAREASGGRAGS